MKKLVIITSITLGVGVLVTYLLIKFLNIYSIDAAIISAELTTIAKVKILFIALLYFSMLIILPFFNTNIVKWFGLNKRGFWKILIALELLALVFSHLSTPPDLTSTILLFMACQLIVIVNVIVFWKTLLKEKN